MKATERHKPENNLSKEQRQALDRILKSNFSKQIINALLESLVRDGRIDPTGKSNKAILGELSKIVRSAGEFNAITDHTPTLLKKSRNFAKNDELNLALTFYATWIEHTLNGMLDSFGRRKKLGKVITLDLIRHTRLNEKYVWLHIILEGKPPSKERLAKLQRLSEQRNRYIHYKWQPEKEDSDSTPLIKEAESLVRHFKLFFRKHFLYNRRRLLQAEGSSL